MRKPSEVKGFGAKTTYFAFFPSSAVKNKKVRRGLYVYVVLSAVLRAVLKEAARAEEARIYQEAIDGLVDLQEWLDNRPSSEV
jgi:hypothetical protein